MKRYNLLPNKVSLEEYTCLTSGNISKYQRLFNCDIEKEKGIASLEEQKPTPKKKKDPVLLDTSLAKPNKLVEYTNPFMESIDSSRRLYNKKQSKPTFSVLKMDLSR